MLRFSNIVVLTGAGISAESGIPTYRGADGLWAGHRVQDVATADAIATNPWAVTDFFNAQRQDLKGKQPNAAHYALATLARTPGLSCHIITQNIDPLHEQAGSPHVHHLHGELLKRTCTECGFTGPIQGDMDIDDLCPACTTQGTLRPDIVLFGEVPKEFDQAIRAIATCDLFVSIGTSGVVYPAADLVRYARQAHAYTICLNLNPEAEATALFDRFIIGPATMTVPQLVGEVMDAIYR